MHKPDKLYPSSNVTKTAKLSEYFPALKNTDGDTDIYFIKGREPGGKMLVMGGTHNDEPSGYLTAIALVENARVDQGELIVIPRANASGPTATWEMQGFPEYVELETSKGVRKIRTGSRYVNSSIQFPDPDVFVNSGGEKYPGAESRNLDRVYPGREGGYLAESIAHGIVELVRKESVDLVLDLHEAMPEHYVTDCLIGHDRAMDLVAVARMELQLQGIDIKMYQSPKVPGFSHRSIGDNTSAYVVLAESTAVITGAFRGMPTQALLQDGKDPFYGILAAKGRLFVNYDPKEGIPLKQRMGRHLATVVELSKALAYVDPSKIILISGVPEYAEVLGKGVGDLLAPKY